MNRMCFEKLTMEKTKWLGTEKCFSISIIIVWESRSCWIPCSSYFTSALHLKPTSVTLWNYRISSCQSLWHKPRTTISSTWILTSSPNAFNELRWRWRQRICRTKKLVMQENTSMNSYKNCALMCKKLDHLVAMKRPPYKISSLDVHSYKYITDSPTQLKYHV